MTLQQSQALFVLYEQMGEAVAQLLQIPHPPGPEEVLLRTEDGREDVGLGVVLAQGVQVVVPELVFHKEDFVGVDFLDKPPHIARCVHGQIAYRIGLGIVLANLVARGREEGDKHLAVRVPLAVGLKHRPCLLELAKAGRMEPYGGLVSRQLAQCSIHPIPAFHHQTGFLVTEKGRHADAYGVEVYPYCIYQSHRLIDNSQFYQ